MNPSCRLLAHPFFNLSTSSCATPISVADYGPAISKQQQNLLSPEEKPQFAINTSVWISTTVTLTNRSVYLSKSGRCPHRIPSPSVSALTIMSFPVRMPGTKRGKEHRASERWQPNTTHWVFPLRHARNPDWISSFVEFLIYIRVLAWSFRRTWYVDFLRWMTASVGIMRMQGWHSGYMLYLCMFHHLVLSVATVGAVSHLMSLSMHICHSHLHRKRVLKCYIEVVLMCGNDPWK